MAKVQQNWEDQPDYRLTVVMDGPTASHVRYEESMRAFWRVVSKFAVSEGSTLAGAARTDDPPAVLMSGGEEPAGAAKPSARGPWLPSYPRAGGCEGGATGNV